MPPLKTYVCVSEMKQRGNRKKETIIYTFSLTKKDGFAMRVCRHMVLFIDCAAQANVDIVGSIFV